MRISSVVLAALFCAAAAAWAQGGVQHKVEATDHMWGLAKRYYGDPYRWRVIAEANPDIKDPNLIYPGQILNIPDLQPEAAAAAPAAPTPPAPQPVEAAAPAPAPEPAPPAPAPEAAPAPRLSEDMPESEPGYGAEQESGRDALSRELPERQAGQYPSMTRFQAPNGWRADGIITGYQDREVAAGQGDLVEGKIPESIQVEAGDRFYVLRQDAAEESDADPKGLYLQRVGIIKVVKVLGKGKFRFVILRAGGTVDQGDMLSRSRL